MVRLVAQRAVDTSDLSELGLFESFRNLDRKGEGKSFDASKGKVDMHVEGTGMLFVLKRPVSGTVDSIAVEVSGHDRYEVSGLDIKLRKMEDTFSGNFEPELFSGDDRFTGSGSADNLSGFAGSDRIGGGGGDDVIRGGDQADRLNGEDGNDTVIGGRGNDALSGGNGKDALTGGAGRDSFLFKNQLAKSNADSITDFAIGLDIIQLKNTVFPGIGGTGQLGKSKFVLASDYDGEDHVVVYDQDAGTLSYAVNGGSLSDAIRFASVSEGLALSNKDFLIV
jgi:Ca2+-binding RTX toxin-like protein